MFTEVLALCAPVGLVDPSITATDGTVLGSPSSLRGQIPLWRIRAEISEIEDKLEELSQSRDRSASDLMTGGLDVDGFVEVVCERNLETETRLRRRLGRLVRAERVCAKRAVDTVPPGTPDPAALRERMAHQEQVLEQMTAEQRAKCDRHVKNPGGRGTVPYPPEQCKKIQEQRELVERTKKTDQCGI